MTYITSRLGMMRRGEFDWWSLLTRMSRHLAVGGVLAILAAGGASVAIAYVAGAASVVAWVVIVEVMEGGL